VSWEGTSQTYLRVTCPAMRGGRGMNFQHILSTGWAGKVCVVVPYIYLFRALNFCIDLVNPIPSSPISFDYFTCNFSKLMIPLCSIGCMVSLSYQKSWTKGRQSQFWVYVWLLTLLDHLNSVFEICLQDTHFELEYVPHFASDFHEINMLNLFPFLETDDLRWGYLKVNFLERLLTH
jgi:hypothetical protein